LLEVYSNAMRHVRDAVAEVDFNDFRGQDYEVIGRLSQALHGRSTEAALWARVFIDLWYCNKFGGPHWAELVARDTANSRYAVQTAYWVFAVSVATAVGATLGEKLTSSSATTCNRSRCHPRPISPMHPSPLPNRRRTRS
jgi:hypothetical protein